MDKTCDPAFWPLVAFLGVFAIGGASALLSLAARHVAPAGRARPRRAHSPLIARLAHGGR